MKRLGGMLAIGLCAALFGCAGKPLCDPRLPVRAQLPVESLTRPAAALPTTFPELAELPAVPAPATGGPFRPLTPAEVQCTAAANAVLGNLLEIEAQITLARPVKNDDEAETAQAEARLLRLRATDQRNRAAGAALEIYYRLLEAEAGVDTLAASLERIERVLAQIDTLRERGLELPVELDRSAWERQRLDLSRRADELASSRLQLNQRLAHLLALPGEEDGPLWPSFPWRLGEAPPAMEEGVALGLATRADLQGIRMLRGLNSENGLSTIRSGLRQADASLGLPPGAKFFAMREARQSMETEMPLRQAQVALLEEDRHRATADEIREAIAGIAEARRLAAAAHAQWQSWTSRAEELELRRNGEITPFDVHAAHLEGLAARQETIKRLVAVELAWVQLRMSQGLLAAECGHGCPPKGCELHVPVPVSSLLRGERETPEPVAPGTIHDPRGGITPPAPPEPLPPRSLPPESSEPAPLPPPQVELESLPSLDDLPPLAPLPE